MRILCVGGGPAGLYAATLLKRSTPSREVVLVERNSSNETFGFGVVFSDPTLERLAAQDPATHRELLDNCVRWTALEVRMRGETVRSDGQGFSAIARSRLLAMLQDRARGAGVDLRFETRFEEIGDLADFDLVVAADGARSGIRARHEETFRPDVRVGRAKYVWFGTTKRFDSLTFIFEQNEHGAFAVHAYPYDDSHSTFLVETDESSWRNAGLDAARDDHGEDLRSLEYCRALFARHLDGHPLISNRSRWTNFRTVRADRWICGNVVLLGDAAHTAHFSVGSGTKMAMEDALTLSRALDEKSEVIEAGLRYDSERRHEIDRLQASARPSLVWWESFRRYMHFDPEQFLVHFLTRNQRVTHASLARRDPELAHRVERWFVRKTANDAASPPAGPLEIGRAPLQLRGLRLTGRIARWRGPEGAPSSVDEASLVVHRAPSPARAEDLQRELDERGGEPGVARGLLLRGDAPDAATTATLARAGRIDLLLWNCNDRAPKLDAFAALRAAWPSEKPLGIHLPRWAVTDAAMARMRPLVELGCDVVCVDADRRLGDKNGEVLLTADRVRNELRVATIVVQAGISIDEVKTIVLAGRADVCLLQAAPERSP